MTARPAEFYRIVGDSVVIPARICALLTRRLRLDELRVQLRGVDPEAYEVLVAIRRNGLEWASPERSEPAKEREPEPRSEWVASHEAANLLGRTSRAVQMACSQGRLRAERVGGRWRIRREDLEHYRRSGHGRNAA